MNPCFLHTAAESDRPYCIPRSYYYQIDRIDRTAPTYCCAVLNCVVPELGVQRRSKRSREPRQVAQDRRDDADSILRFLLSSQSRSTAQHRTVRRRAKQQELAHFDEKLENM